MRRVHDVRTTHTLVPTPLVRRLRKLSERSRVPQSELLREALADVLRKHLGRTSPAVADYDHPDGPGELVSVVFRVDRRDLDALNELAARTRVRVSEYIREGVADVIKKHGGWLVSAGVRS